MVNGTQAAKKCPLHARIFVYLFKFKFNISCFVAWTSLHGRRRRLGTLQPCTVHCITLSTISFKALSVLNRARCRSLSLSFT